MRSIISRFSELSVFGTFSVATPSRRPAARGHSASTTGASASFRIFSSTIAPLLRLSSARSGAQAFFQLALRFSRKAFTPSFWSSVSKRSTKASRSTV